MHKKIVLLLLILIPFVCNAQERNNHGFDISITVKPQIIDKSIPRGITINFVNYIGPSFYWNLSGRIMNKDYTSIWTSAGFNLHLGGNISLPINAGAGLKIKSFDLTENNKEGLNLFLHAKAGILWNFDINWSYSLYATYNYDLFIENEYNIFIDIGMIYLF